MDFSQYVIVASYFTPTPYWWTYVLAISAFILCMFGLQAAALFIIAKREGYKHKWMAFVPFVSTYYIGVVSQNNRVFKGFSTKVVALITAILEAALLGCSILFYVACFKLSAGGYLQLSEDPYHPLEIIGFIPPNLVWAGNCVKYLEDITYWFDLVLSLFEILLLAAFFQTYSARHYFWFTLLCVLFPVQGIIMFIIRKNKALNYRDYIRGEQERKYRMYRQYSGQDFENNPYNQNPYSRNQYRGDYDEPNPSGQRQDGRQNGSSNGGNPAAPEDPFAEFGSDGGDPFDGPDDRLH